MPCMHACSNGCTPLPLQQFMHSWQKQPCHPYGKQPATKFCLHDAHTCKLQPDINMIDCFRHLNIKIAIYILASQIVVCFKSQLHVELSCVEHVFMNSVKVSYVANSFHQTISQLARYIAMYTQWYLWCIEDSLLKATSMHTVIS